MLKNKKRVLKRFLYCSITGFFVLTSVLLSVKHKKCHNAGVRVMYSYMQLEEYTVHLEDINDELMESVFILENKLDAMSHGKPVYFTAYNAVPWQTDDTPTITASGATIYEGSCALPRNLLTTFNPNATFSYGDTAWFVIEHDKSWHITPYVVEDTMNARFRRTLDIFMDDLHVARQFGKRKGFLPEG